jgi:hypothetical protein
MSLSKRLTDHLLHNGHFKGLNTDGVKSRDVSYSIQVEKVYNVYEDNIDVNVSDYIETLEWKKFCQYVEKFDEPVLGGK